MATKALKAGEELISDEEKDFKMDKYNEEMDSDDLLKPLNQAKAFLKPGEEKDMKALLAKYSRDNNQAVDVGFDR